MKGNTTSRKTAAAAEVRLVDVESNQFQYQNFQSRARLDARLWLTCRLALVKTLNMEIRGMGEVKGEWKWGAEAGGRWRSELGRRESGLMGGSE